MEKNEFTTARLLDAREVDSFDYNRLTLYYYYLRVWTIKYTNLLYPDILKNNRWLYKLLKMVKPTSEEELRALQFFKKHVIHIKRSRNTSFYIYILLYTSYYKY